MMQTLRTTSSFTAKTSVSNVRGSTRIHAARPTWYVSPIHAKATDSVNTARPGAMAVGALPATRIAISLWHSHTPPLSLSSLGRYPGAAAPAHLDGSMAGDYGFDPLRLGTNKEVLPYYAEAELTNGRWAMMAVAGILFTDLVGAGDWWTAGAKEYSLDTKTQLAVEIPVMAVLEAMRVKGWEKTGTSGAFGMHPFDPMGMASDEKKLKEVKNARLAMVAFLGFASQAAVRGMGPIECLKLHLEDPGHNNIFTSAVGPEATVACMVLGITPVILEAKKALGDNDEEFRPIPW